MVIVLARKYSSPLGCRGGCVRKWIVVKKMDFCIKLRYDSDRAVIFNAENQLRANQQKFRNTSVQLRASQNVAWEPDSKWLE